MTSFPSFSLALRKMLFFRGATSCFDRLWRFGLVQWKFIDCNIMQVWQFTCKWNMYSNIFNVIHIPIDINQMTFSVEQPGIPFFWPQKEWRNFGESKVEPVDGKLRRCKSNLLRHVTRMNSNRMPKIMLNFRSNRRRRLGRQLKRSKQVYRGLTRDGQWRSLWWWHSVQFSYTHYFCYQILHKA